MYNIISAASLLFVSYTTYSLLNSVNIFDCDHSPHKLVCFIDNGPYQLVYLATFIIASTQGISEMIILFYRRNPYTDYLMKVSLFVTKIGMVLSGSYFIRLLCGVPFKYDFTCLLWIIVWLNAILVRNI